GGKRGEPSPEAYRALGVGPLKMSLVPPGEIEARLTHALINEAAFCMADEVVAAPSKLDLAMIFGTGFPPFRGGLLRYADSLGPPAVAGTRGGLAGGAGLRSQPAPVLKDMARSGARFHSDARPVLV